ncbi:hypothetical protein [Clostridium sp.]|uniref:hypothetical protein n=1 Tax=Clostridium sp. TaxID=1506 RepID=UPI001B42D7FB|nr:hypothetical protein [Clostridium sp.]MBP3917141.1 hypothetical protein [Clostridium sp.]
MIKSKIAREVFINCLLREDDLKDCEDKDIIVYATAYGKTIPFNKEKLEFYKNEIDEMTKGIPENPRKTWEFMNLCLPAENNLWSNIHDVCEKVIFLAVATGKIPADTFKEEFHPIPQGKKIFKNNISIIIKDFNSKGTIGMSKTWTIANNVRISFMPKMERIEIPFQKS